MTVLGRQRMFNDLDNEAWSSYIHECAASIFSDWADLVDGSFNYNKLLSDLLTFYEH